VTNFKKLLFSFLLFLLFFFSSYNILADDTTSSLQQKINSYTQKLLELSKQKNTLSNQIKYLNSQVYLTSLKISQSEASIKVLHKEIDQLSQEISRLDLNLNQLSQIFLNQVSQNYKIGKKVPIISIFSSLNFNHFLEQYKYIKILQKANQNNMLNLETTRTTYDIQKQKKLKKEEELAKLQKTLDSQKKELVSQKSAKNNLLAITKNDEKKYQKLKSEAERELSSLLQAKFVGKRHVSAGEALGLMGNSGYSFGDHLHFGLYQLEEKDISKWSYRNDISSLSYLSKHRWPMNQPIRITQNRGVTKYAYLYGDHFHHGIDMVSPNKTIFATEEGVAYFFRNPKSSLGNHIKLFHPDGKMTLYLHMQ